MKPQKKAVSIYVICFAVAGGAIAWLAFSGGKMPPEYGPYGLVVAAAGCVAVAWSTARYLVKQL